jgi:hypothetical protein
MNNKPNSLITFRLNLAETKDFIKKVHYGSGVLEQVCPEEIKQRENLIIDNKHYNKIWQLGFIHIIASFEFFMYDLLVELFKNHPNSLPKEKQVKIEEIQNFDNIQSLNEYIIDSIAIEKSYDLEVWAKTLENCFGIVPFENEMVKKTIQGLNLYRNMILHSGGKMNSKFVKDSLKIFSDSTINISNYSKEKHEHKWNEFFWNTIMIMESIIDYLEKKVFA